MSVKVSSQIQDTDRKTVLNTGSVDLSIPSSARIDHRQISVSDAGVTHTIDTAIGDVGLVVIRNRGSYDVDWGLASGQIIGRVKAGEHAVFRGTPALASLYLDCVTASQSSEVEIRVWAAS